MNVEDTETQKQVQSITKFLGSLHALDALQVLNQVSIAVLARAPRSDFDSLEVSQTYKRLSRRGRPSKIDRDPELKAFILSLDDHLFLHEITDKCVRKFGVKRALSRSGLHRFIQSQTACRSEKS